MTQAAAATASTGVVEASYTPVVSSSGMSYCPILELGEGGMAKVYLASAKGPGGFTKLVVLKSMHERDLGDDAIRSMFVEEARLSARFNHPNLVQVQEASIHTDPPFLVMEYLDGKPLSALRGRDRVTLGMRLAIISEVLTGLEYAHNLCDFDGAPLGIVHRDVSPHNVFITYDGSVKVLDFGIAKVVTSSMRTQAGEVKGKLAYMAPEQMLGAAIDRRADVFSVGSLLWEAAVGKRMWDGLTEPHMMHRLAVGDIPRPSQAADVDPELEEIIVKATAPDAKERYASAQELQQALDAYRARVGEHSSIREIGALLAESHQDERRRNAALISAALQNSVPPPPAPIVAATEPAVASTARSRLPVLLVLALFAVAGVVAARLFPGKKPEVAPPVVHVTSAVTAAATQPQEPAPVPATPLEMPTPPLASAPVNSAPRTHRATRGVVPPPAATTSVAAPAPVPAAANCNPPYYFERGIKTFKQECL